MSKLECYHADTCLSDYWSGHHRPYISIPSYKMSFKELKQALHSEVSQGAIAGSFDHELLASDLFYKRLHAAINRIKPAKKYSKVCFTDIESSGDEYNDTVYAYFVFDN